MKKLFILLALSFTFINTSAQYSLSGTVLDAQKNTLPGASITIKNTQIGTLSDMDGNYTLHSSEKDIVVVFSYSGFHQEKIVIHFNKNNQKLDVVLKENVFEIDEVILSTPFNKLQSENVVKVSYKSVQSMQKKGIQNLMDGIAQISGVRKMSTGTGISKPVIRGLSGSRVLIYNQGVRLENFQYGDKHGMGISEAGIESVEVIKGPASLLYGSDAIGGVVYLVPEKYALPKLTQANFQSQYFSNTEGFNTNIGVKSSIENWQYLVRAALSEHADYRIPANNMVTNSRYNNKDLKAGIGYKNDLITTDIRYNFNKSQNGIPKKIGIQESSYKMSGLYQDLDNHVLSLKNTIKIKKTQIKTNIGYTNHKRVLIKDEKQKIGMQLNTLNYDTKFHLPNLKKLESIIGIQGMHQTNTNFGMSYLLPDAKIDNIGIFGTANYQIKKISIQGGLRYDTRHIITQDVSKAGEASYRPGFDKQLESYTGSLGFKSNIFKKLNIRFNMAAGFRSPNLSELASYGQHAGRIEIGNKNIKNENNWQTDFALEYENPHIEFFANAFYNQIHNYIFLAPTGEEQESMVVYQYNQKDAYLYGSEIGFHIHPHPWDWLHIETSFETVTGKSKNGDYLPLIPANRWNNQIRFINDNQYKHLDKWFVNIGIMHTFKAINVSQFESTQDAYTLFNSSLGGDFSYRSLRLNLSISAHNIFNKDYISHLSVLREQEIPEIGRNIILGVNIKI